MAQHSLFGVKTTQVGNVTVLRLRGELDRLTGPQLAHALAEAQQSGLDIIVALADITYIDLGGIRLLEEAGRRAREEGRSFIVVEPGPVVSRIFRIIEFERGVPVRATVGEALQLSQAGGESSQ